MNEDLKADASEAIRYLVRTGFYTAADIHESVAEDLFEPDDIDDDWLKSQIKDEFARKAEDETTWPTVTDCDRLDQTFRDLNAAGIIALQNAGYTQSDGLDDVTQSYHEQGGPQSPVTGYCFYHGQDLERAVAGRGLLLTFGDINGDDAKGVEIGRRIVSLVKQNGFTVGWPGTIAERISLTNITWQRRGEASVEQE